MVGKDIIIFVTPEDHKKPSTVTLADDDEYEPGTLCWLMCIMMKWTVIQLQASEASKFIKIL